MLRDPDEALREMTDKHTTANSPPDLSALGELNVGLAPQAAADDVLAALKSFNQHSGAGPSGLRPWALRQALGPAYADQVVEHMTP